MTTSKWITDRPPTEQDVDIRDCIFVREWRDGLLQEKQSVTLQHYLTTFKDGHPWCHTSRKRKRSKEQNNQMTLIADQSCCNCRFYRNGECRRRAPVEKWGGSWPQPMSNDWCGEWEARK